MSRKSVDHSDMNRQLQQYEVPPDLQNLLIEFTVSVLVEQPRDLVDYAASYFANLKDSRGLENNIGSDQDDEPFMESPPQTRPVGRRKSVFAETYDPEADEEDEAAKIVHPKSDEQRQRLYDAVKKNLLFRNLDQQQMQEVLDAMFEKEVAEGENIIKQGDDGDNFYVIESGKFQVTVTEAGETVPRVAHTYDGSGSFGELALMYNMPRAATITALTKGLVWCMDRQTFRRILLKSSFKKRKMYTTLIEKVPMLRELEPYEKLNLADALVPKCFKPGDLIIRQGDPADGMYFVEQGKVRVTMNTDNGGEKEVSTTEEGGYFGELALVTHKARAANVYAISDVRLAFLEVEAFERLLGKCMEIMKRNIENYYTQVTDLFGSLNNIEDAR